MSSIGTRTRGYWVNHPEDWPAGTIRLGNNYYTKAQAIDILQTATRGDKSYQMAAQLIAAKLNMAAGCDPSCIEQTVLDADNWLRANPIGGKIKNWGPGGEATHNRLDDYNNGRLCVGHMN